VESSILVLEYKLKETKGRIDYNDTKIYINQNTLISNKEL
jgi:hypothetical protein